MDPDQLLIENKRLQHCISDLVSIMALPAMWAGRDGSEIGRTLLESLMSMLELDIAYLLLRDPNGNVSIELARLSEQAAQAETHQGLCSALRPWIDADLPEWPQRLAHKGGDLAIVPLRLGLGDDVGLLVAGSRRKDFPRQSEDLLLSVAANQATIGLHAARSLRKQRQLTNELDQRVAQRTNELALANETLRRRELDFRLVVDSIPVPVAVTTPAGDVEGVNQPMIEYFGKSFHELKDWKIADAVNPDDVASTIKAQITAYASGETYNVQNRYRRYDGVYRWFNTFGVPMRGPRGEILRWFHLFIDIDPRKRAEEALAASERNLAQIIDTIPVYVWSAGSDGRTDFINRHYLGYLGLAREQVREWTWSSAIHPDDVEAHINVWNGLLASGRAGEFQARLRRFDGNYRWFLFRVNPLTDSAGNVTWFGVTIDIEELKRAEDRLRESEWNLRRLTEAIPQMLWSATAEGSVDYCNTRMLDFTGFAASDIIGDGWNRLIHPDDLDQTRRAWSMSVATGSPYQVEARLFRAADRSYRWCLTTGLPLRDEQGRILKWHGVCVDMHDWKEAQDELRETQAELAHVTRVMTMGQLTASVAHELNQPLSGIMMNTGTGLRMLTADPPNIDGARETARRTIRDAKRASEVVARLRALFTKKASASEIVDMNAAAQEVIALSSNELQRNSVSVRAALAKDLPYVTGDRVQLQQVILNFIMNGAEAMAGVVDRPRELIVSTVLEESGHVRVAVKDAGVGFDAAAAKRLFSPFYTTKKEGMGIGLSVSRTIVESHQGRLWASRNDGPGSTFCFSVPSTLVGGPAEATTHILPTDSVDATGNV